MPGLLDFLQSPQTALAAGLLTPTLNRKTGPALLQGLQAANTQGFSNQRNLAAKQAVAKAEQDAQQRKQTASLLQNFNGDLNQLASSLLTNPGTTQQGISLLGAIKPSTQALSGVGKLQRERDIAIASGDNTSAKELSDRIDKLNAPAVPLIDFSGVTKSQRGKVILNNENLKVGRDIVTDILSGLESGEEPAGITRTVVGGLQGAVDQLTTAADQVTNGAVSRGLSSLAGTINNARSILNKDISDGNITRGQAKDLGLIDTKIAITDLKRNILTYMVARLNVGSGQKITNQMITEAKEQTQIGGFGGGGQQIAIGRFRTLQSLFDSRINANNALINQESGGDAENQMEAILRALSNANQ
ncbi:MAG: hypothetical protein BMS9Abin21_208 [Thermodesulfovibrionia bacterium]|nr:MAG: hypothetical protein BMS9Abin21_208 [Thermodesulfovibrionia bacterium]